MTLKLAAANIAIRAAAEKVAETLGPFDTAYKGGPAAASINLAEVKSSRAITGYWEAGLMIWKHQRRSAKS